MMNIKRKIKVLVVDDSLLFREVLAKGIATDNGLQVVGTASDPYDARDKILKLEPDVMVLDVEMPRMNGIDFLRRLMPQYPIPVIVISSEGANVFEALNSGAVEFAVKPRGKDSSGVQWFINELIIKIKIASTARVGTSKKSISVKSNLSKVSTDLNNKVIAIGASTGGTEAITSILKALPQKIPGIVITQHMPPNFTRMFADRLNSSCSLEVKEAENGDKIYPGRVLIAPGDYHMRVNKTASSYFVECFKGEKVNGHCPSVSVLFQSVAQKVGKNAVGVILTGMGYDGAKELLLMRKEGARTIGQDEQSSIVYGMPKVAYNIGAVEKQSPLINIPQLICSMI